MKHVKRFLIVISCCCVAVFLIQNFEVATHIFKSIEINLLVPGWKWSWAVYNGGIIGVSFLLGAFVLFLLTFTRDRSTRSELVRSRETVKDLEKKVGKLEAELLQSKTAGYQEKPSPGDIFRTPE